MVHIKSESNFIDDNVKIQIELPAVPRVGETLYLDECSKGLLEALATYTCKIAKHYFPKWFYGNSYGCKKLKRNNLDDLSFDDAVNVVSVTYKENSDIIHIELDDCINQAIKHNIKK